MSYRVFVAAEPDELNAHQQSVSDALHDLGMSTVEPATASLASRQYFEASLLGVRGADLFLGIYGTHYGEILPDQELSHTELIYNEALDLKLPCFVYLIDPQQSWVVEHVEGDTEGAMQRIFLDRLQSENPNFRYFTSSRDLAHKVAFDLARYKSEKAGEHSYNRRHFLIGMLILWLVLLIVALRMGPIG